MGDLRADAFTILAYGLFSFLVVFPPTELISAGLTLDKVFGALLGDEQIEFVQHHIRRTSLNVVAHSLLPLGFFFILELQDEGLSVLNLLWDQGGSVSGGWRLFMLGSLCLPLAALSLVAFWRIGDWREHPTARRLALYSPNWRRAAESINNEYRRIDKFSVALGGIRRVVVTDSWILLVTQYQLELSQQSESRLEVVSSDSHVISHHGDTETQFITILVSNQQKPIRPFKLRLNSLNYSDLRGKLAAPITHARELIIHQTLDEQFVVAFLEAARRNEPTVWTQEEKSVLDQCLGCGNVTSDVKLEKRCVDTAEEEVDEEGAAIPNCRACFCRPMWCVACMGRWFASRQNPHHPERWLGGKSPCPTCRATFCLLDVSILQ